MDARLNFITLAVTDMAACRSVYIDGLGWEPLVDGSGIVMVRMAPTLILSLWAIEEFEAEVGPVRKGPGVVASGVQQSGVRVGGERVAQLWVTVTA